MDSLSSVSPSIVLPPPTHHHYHHHHRRRIFFQLSSYSTPTTNHGLSFNSKPSRRRLCIGGGGFHCKALSSNEGEEAEEDKGKYIRDDDEELERALRMDGTIPGTSNEFVEQVSSRAYGMRRHLHQTFDSSSYDVLDANPWRETSKPVYVLTHKENQLCSMKTRQKRSEVERELGLLFSRGKSQNTRKQAGTGMKFQMFVEDVREGILVFEDENEASRYCDLLQGGGQGCEGVAEIEASSVFDLCRKMKALAVLFRRGRTPPVPENLKLNLGARKRSLEDEDEDA